MLKPHRIATAALAASALAACSADTPSDAAARSAEAPTTAQLTERMLEAMGGREALESVELLVREGSGSRTRLGQIPETGGTDPTGRLTELTETIDFANERAAFDYEIVNNDFSQHRTEVLTTWEGERIGWGTTSGRENIAVSPDGLFSWATQNSPRMLLRRNVITLALAAGETASADEVAERSELDGRDSWRGTAQLPSGEEVELYFDVDSGLLNGYAALDTETMLGDVEARYLLDDYRSVDGVALPHSLTVLKEGRPYSSVEYSSVAVDDANAAEIFAVPDDVLDQAEQVVAADGPWSPLEWNEVAPGLYHAVGFSHHGMVVEFDDFVAVVEGPYTEAQSLTLARRVDAELGKPIRYVAPTHPHYDHTGGVRALAAVGADVVVASGHENELRGIVESPHTNPPDELARRRAAGEDVGGLDVFEGMTAIADDGQRLELYEVDGIPHVRPMVLAYVPGEGVLFQSDLFFGAPGPDASALYEAVVDLGLEPQTIVGGHGGPWPFSELEQVAGPD